MKTFDNLKPREKQFCQAVLTRDVKNAATECGISETTAHRWIRRDDIQAAIGELEADALEMISRRLLLLADGAAAVLDAVLSDPAAKPGDRLRAADLVLSNLLRVRELVDIESRLSALEAQNER
jgi:hypothetical protein